METHVKESKAEKIVDAVFKDWSFCQIMSMIVLGGFGWFGVLKFESLLFLKVDSYNLLGSA